MNLYNSLTRKIDPFEPLQGSEVNIYTCGPTVYDYAHIGHWFNYVRMDTLIRTLKANNYKVNWVMNITDVGHLVSDADEGEDKLQKGADREGKTAWQVAEYYTQDFIKGMKALNISPVDHLVKATDHVDDQINLIKKLDAKGFVYVIDDGVYYDTSKFPQYADFAQLDLDEQQAGARVNYNQQKRNASDFAVWKFSPVDKKRDMEWDSPWGKGFPGWHIECSAMAMKYLGDTLDIHTGGIDHVPVHHTNEIAQSQAVTGKPLANYWMHSNHVMIDGTKISKSLGNGIRLQDAIEAGIVPMALRLHILESSYRNQSQFSMTSLIAAQNRLNELYALAALRWQALDTVHLLRLLSEDLGTPQALAFLSQVSTQLLTVLIEKDMLQHFEAMLKGIDDLLGLDLRTVHDINESQKQLISARQAARQSEDWKLADELRQELEQQGIGQRDTSQGVIWFPLTPPHTSASQ